MKNAPCLKVNVESGWWTLGLKKPPLPPRERMKVRGAKLPQFGFLLEMGTCYFFFCWSSLILLRSLSVWSGLGSNVKAFS